MSIQEEETDEVDMKIKYGNEVHEFYDVPVDISTEKLLSQVVMEICTPELKLPGGKMLKFIRPKYTFQKWRGKHGDSLDELRGVLQLKQIGGDDNSENNGILEEKEKKIEMLEKGKKKFKEKLMELNMELIEKAGIIAQKSKNEEDLLRKNEMLQEKNKMLHNKLAGLEEEKGKFNRTLLELAHNRVWGLNGERIDYNTPRMLYTEIVNSGARLDAKSHFNLGYMNWWGYGVMQDRPKARLYYKKAAEIYTSKKVDDLKPVDCNNMAFMFMYGRGLEKNDKKAVELLEMAVRRGNVLAMNHLGDCYDTGFGVQKSDSEAFKLWTKAAGMGLPDAKSSLGYMFDKGIGVNQDKMKAFALYREAAEQGHIMAMFNVGVFYKNGWVVEKNVDKVRRWFKKASDLGHEGARKQLKSL